MLGAGVAAALVLGGVANAVNLGRDAGYVLGATAIALVAGIGIPWALGWRAPVLFERRQEMQAHKAAVVAYKRQSWIALPSDVISSGLEQHGNSGIRPVFYVASGAFASRSALAGQSGFEVVQVSNRHLFDPTTFEVSAH